jgi:hypothetical protein
MITLQKFIHNEIEDWGFDYVSDLFDKGHEPIQIRNNRTGELHWVWHQFVRPPRDKRPLVRMNQ